MPLTLVQSGVMDSVAQYYSMKNRIINGAMVIDQRNAGASVTQGTANTYTLDRWVCAGLVTSKFTVQQNAGSVTPPAGFTNYLGITSSSAYAIGASDYYYLMQGIEGFNVSDLGWGTANAQTVTLSFWVRSSLTGTFGGAIRNLIPGATRAYPFSFSVPAANTWTQISVSIPGDTTGTWATGNGNSLTVCFSMGAGSTFSGTAGAWAGSNLISATGAVSVVGTNGATFYITGVQLEKGSTATSFDYRPYGTELALCQRYFEKSWNVDTAIGTATTAGATLFQSASSTQTIFNSQKPFAVQKRATPTMTYYNPNSGAINSIRDASANADFSVLGNFHTGASSTGAVATNSSVTAGNQLQAHYTASIEL